MDATDIATFGGEPYIDYPFPSPTSRLGINIRYYSGDSVNEVGVFQDGGASRFSVDVGPIAEQLIENLYFDFSLADKGVKPDAFESSIRDYVQHRLAYVNAYALSTALYVLFTTDPGEASRLTKREYGVLHSQGRRYPYMAHSVYQKTPKTLRGAIRWLFGTLRAAWFH